VGIRWLGDSTRSIAQIFLGVVFDVSFHLYDFCCGSDCKKGVESEMTDGCQAALVPQERLHHRDTVSCSDQLGF
jgi:hypothetical protein